MKRIRILSVIMIFILTFTASSCSRGEDAFYIYHASNTNLKSVDPQIASGDTARIIAVNCFEGLVYINSDGAIESAAAESYIISPDGLTYTFKLRKDMTWRVSDSAKKALKLSDDFDNRVTAHDFVFALRRAVSPETKADDALLLSPIVNAEEIMDGILSDKELGVTAISDYELEIRLNYKQSSFIYTLAQPVSMPCNEVFFGLTGGRYGLKLEYLITNGPFYFSRWADNSSLRLTKNADYNGARISSADAVFIYVNPDKSDVTDKLNSGAYTSAFLSKAQFGQIKKVKDFGYLEYENILWAFCFNFNSEVFSSPDMRKAVISSLNPDIFKGEHNENTLAERYVPLFCEPEFSKASTVETLTALNEDKARDYLKNALYALDTDSVEATLLCTAEYERLLKEQLQEWQRILGVSVNIKITVLEFEEFEKACAAGNYDFALYPLYANGLDVKNFFKSFVTGDPANFIGMNNEEYNNRFSELFNTASQHDFGNIYSGLENILAQTAAYYPIYNDKNYFVYSNKISGIYFYSSQDYVNFSFAKLAS